MKKGSQLQKFYATKSTEDLQKIISENTEKARNCLPQLSDFYRNQIFLAKKELEKRA